MIEIYAKRQRSKRKDPQQEAIVGEKSNLNDRTSRLISLLIALKKGWNGGPSPNIGVEKFNLTQPIPDTVVGSGDTAAHELSEIVQTLHQIKSMQDTYAAAHAQRSEQLKQMQPAAAPAAPAPPQAQPESTPTIAALEELLLIKQASNPFSRVWTHIIAYNPFVSERNRGQRLALLRSLARVNANLKDIEEDVLGMGESSILDSIYIARQLYSDAKSSFFGTFRRNIDQMLFDANKQLEELKKHVGEGEPLEKDKPARPMNPVVKKTILEGISSAQEVISEPVSEESSEKPVDELTPGQKVISPKPAVPAAPVVEPQVTKKRKKKRKVPLAPAPQVTSDFIDSDLEQAQYEERYREIAKFLNKNIDVLAVSSFDIVNKNFPEPWGSKIKQAYRNVYNIGNLTIYKIRHGQDYELDYVAFLKEVGLIKSMEYVASIEQTTEGAEPGSMMNESELNSQADNFARSEYTRYQEMIQSVGKIAQASAASRFIKRMITHIIPRKDRNLRLMISRNIRQAREGLQGMMDVLEDRHLNFRRLTSMSDLFFESLRHMYEGLADIADMYNATMRMEKSYRKQREIKMTYDLIPAQDINALRMMQTYLEKDTSNIQKLEELEASIMDASEKLEALKK